MPRPRFQKLEPARQRQILEAAGAEFAAHGFEQASLNHVIESLGLSKGVFYYYFDSKADLFAAVVNLMWDTLFPGPEFDIGALDRQTFWPSLAELTTHVRGRMQDMPWLAGVSRLLYHPLPAGDLDAFVAAKFTRAREWLGDLLRRGQEVGAVRTDLPLDLLQSVLMAADTAADHWLADHWDALGAGDQARFTQEIFGIWKRIAQPTPALSLERAS